MEQNKINEMFLWKIGELGWNFNSVEELAKALIDKDKLTGKYGSLAIGFKEPYEQKQIEVLYYSTNQIKFEEKDIENAYNKHIIRKNWQINKEKSK